MKKIFLGVYHPSVLLTYLGLSISLYGIFFSKTLAFSLILLILAGKSLRSTNRFFVGPYFFWRVSGADLSSVFCQVRNLFFSALGSLSSDSSHQTCLF